MRGSLVSKGESLPPFADYREAPKPGDHAAALNRDVPAPALVLIIEDNPGDVFIMEEALREHCVDCSVTVLSDGEQASEFFDRIDEDFTAASPRLVLLDLNLPKRSGHWVLKRIRDSYRCSSVPVIVVSSSEAVSDLAANRDLGATAYFRKPSNLDAFLKLGAMVNALL